MDISFVILTWNSASYIGRCLDSIFSSLENTDLSFEIFVVDNGSRDNSVQILKEYETKNTGVVVPIFLRENVGTTVSRNLALRQAQGTFLCVMDSDVEVGIGVFPALLEILRTHPKAGMVVPKLLYPSGKWQKSIDQFPTLAHKANRFFRLRRIEAEEGSATSKNLAIQEVEYAISALWLFPREIVQKVGLLDENIFYAPEDVDYCLRIWKGGFRILYVQSVSVIHHTQEISRGWRFNKAKFEHLKGLVYFFIKHKYLFRKPEFKFLKH